MFFRRVGCPLQIVSPSKFESASVPSYLLKNFAVASQLVANVLAYFGNSEKWDDSIMRETLCETRLPARAQTVQVGKHRVLLDGAHTPLSMREACSWFHDQLGAAKCGVLFYCGRDKHLDELLSELTKLNVEKMVVCGVKNPKPEYT